MAASRTSAQGWNMVLTLVENGQRERKRDQQRTRYAQAYYPVAVVSTID
jgi:hypothetical protein